MSKQYHSDAYFQRGLRRKARRRRGNYLVEFSLAFFPMFVLMMAIIDFSMPIFLRSAFTHAVREGARYGITFQTMAGKTHTESIKEVVLANSSGFLSGQSGLDKVQVKWYSPVTFLELTGSGANGDGNIVEVSIPNYQWGWMAPLWRSASPQKIGVHAADRLETLPNGAARPACGC